MHGFLKQQIDLIKPEIIVALGRYAAHYLLNSKAPLGKLRTQTHTFSDTNIPLYITYHPAYLLRNPADKRKAWEDWKKIKAALEAV